MIHNIFSKYSPHDINLRHKQLEAALNITIPFRIIMSAFQVAFIALSAVQFAAVRSKSSVAGKRKWKLLWLFCVDWKQIWQKYPKMSREIRHKLNFTNKMLMRPQTAHLVNREQLVSAFDLWALEVETFCWIFH